MISSEEAPRFSGWPVKIKDPLTSSRFSGYKFVMSSKRVTQIFDILEWWKNSRKTRQPEDLEIDMNQFKSIWGLMSGI